MPDLNKAYQWAIDTCNASNVGYSQSYRNQQSVNGITYYDCSSFVWFALKAGGFDVVAANGGSSWPFTTYSMPTVLIALGFAEIDATGEWKSGDIALSSSHTEMVYRGDNGQGICMGAHTSGASLQNQVSIGSSTGDESYISTYSRFPRLFRYGEGGAGGYGASIYVVSAICGNFWQESGINPGIWEGLQTDKTWTDLLVGYGLGQWTNTGGDTQGRLYQLHEYLANNGYSVEDGDGQLAFLIHENVWYPQQEASAFESLQDFLSSDSTDIELLTHAYNIGWEGIHDDSWEARVGYAHSVYQFLRDRANDTSIKEWVTGNRYLSEEERLNNAVLVYRYLSSGGGGGGTTRGKSKMPLWMYCKFTY